MGFGKMAVHKKRCARHLHIMRILVQEAKPHELEGKIRETGAAGYILLWLLGIPIPILLLIFLPWGCT
jgi:hypothetical protein